MRAIRRLAGLARHLQRARPVPRVQDRASADADRHDRHRREQGAVQGGAGDHPGRAGARPHVPRAPRSRRRDAVRLGGAPAPRVLDEEHADPAGHDLHQRRLAHRRHRPERRAEDADRARGRRLSVSTCSRSAAGCPRVTGSAPGSSSISRRAAPASSRVGWRSMQPMLAVQADAPLSDPDLVYELKYDGIRALVTVHAGARKEARRGRDRVARRQRQDRAVPGGGARAVGLGRGALERRPCSTARSSRWTRTGSPPDFSAFRIAFI